MSRVYVSQLRREDVGDLTVDTVDMFSNFFRGKTPLTPENIAYQVLVANSYGRYETMIFGTGLPDPPAWRTRTWQAAIRQHEAVVSALGAEYPRALTTSLDLV